MSLNRIESLSQFSTTMIKYLPPSSFTQLARQGPAVSVIPVFIPMYSSGFCCSSRCVFSLSYTIQYHLTSLATQFSRTSSSPCYSLESRSLSTPSPTSSSPVAISSVGDCEWVGLENMVV